MADANDWGDTAVVAQPKANDWGDAPIAHPKIPDMSGAQKMATGNMAANDNKATPEGGEPKPPQTPQERLDTATGMPIQAVINGTAKPSDVPQAVREDYNNHVKAGTVNNFGSYMQLMLHQVAPIAAGIIRASNAMESTMQQTSERYVGTMAYPFLSAENQQKLEKLGIVPPAGGTPINPEAPIAVKALHGFAEGVGGTLGTALSAPYLAASTVMAPITNPIMNAAANVAPSKYASVVPDILNLGMTALGVGGIHHIATTEPQFPAGAGPWDNHPGSEVIKDAVAKKLGKEPNAVTSQDIDQTLAAGSKNLAPHGDSYGLVANAMSQLVYHGTPHEFDRFSLDHIGTGEGADAYGHGLYFTSNADIANQYASNNGKVVLNGETLIPTNKLAATRINLHGNLDDAIQSLEKDIGNEKSNIESGFNQKSHFDKLSEFQDAYNYLKYLKEKGASVTTNGNVYHAIIPSDENMLHWTKPLSEQPTAVQKALEGVKFDKNAATGAAIYSDIAKQKSKEVTMSWGEKVQVPDKKAASEFLDSIGIKGIKYFADMQRGARGEQGHNYVVFNDDSVTKISPEKLKDTLHEIYEKTGIPPEQAFKDAQADHAIAEDIGAGKIPAAYSHLLDTRPAIPDDVSKAMAGMDTLSKENPSVPLSQEGASNTGLLSAVAKIFNPTGQSEAAGEMATALRQGRGPVAQYVAQIQDGLSGFAKTVSKMGDNARLAFIDYIENRSGGAELHDPELQPLADKIRDVYAAMADKIGQLFPDVKMRQDYFTHQYTDEAKAAKFFSDWAAKQGSERNLQQRVFPTLKEAMAAGLEPKSTNPIDTVMNYVTNIGKLDAAHRSLNLAREAGIAEFFDEGQQPEGWVPLGGKLATEGGKLLYAPEDAARVYNNDISKGFTGPIGEIVDAVGRVNNFNNMLMLSISAYHAAVTTLSSMSKDIGRALTQGSLTERAGSLLSAVTPLKNTLQGGKLIDAYLGREELSPEAQKTMDALVKNNAINIRMQDYWKAGPAKTYIDVFQHGSVGEEIGHAKETIKEAPVTGTLKVIANEVGRTMNTVSAPLFEHYIPRIKLAAAFNEMHSWMKEHPEATPEEIDKAAQDIGNSADNAFGEMNRDNLFWHNITRQTLQTAFLSYSWIAGAARMLQGIPDIGKTIMGQQELTSNARYLMGMAATYAAVNGVRTYLGTGHAPDQILDFIYPRTGGVTPQSKEERALLPSHIGQYTQYLYHGIGELGNEASPTLKLLYHLLSNSDFRGLPLTNENNPWYTDQRWNDYAHYVLGEETPFGLKTFITGKMKGSEISTVERAAGVRQAPREITDPEGQKSMMQKINDSLWKKKERSDKKQKAKYESDEED